MYFKINPLVAEGIVFKLLHIHTGFNDFSFLWIVNGRLMDIFFIRVN